MMMSKKDAARMISDARGLISPGQEGISDIAANARVGAGRTWLLLLSVRYRQKSHPSENHRIGPYPAKLICFYTAKRDAGRWRPSQVYRAFPPQVPEVEEIRRILTSRIRQKLVGGWRKKVKSAELPLTHAAMLISVLDPPYSSGNDVIDVVINAVGGVREDSDDEQTKKAANQGGRGVNKTEN